MSWGQVAIEDIAQVKGGKRLPKGHDFVTYTTPHPYIRARDIGQGKIEIKDYVYLSEETHEKLKRYIVNKGDVVITIVGANVGDVGYVQDNLDGANLTENAAKLVVDNSKIDPYFLKLYLSTEQSKKRLAFIASGAAQGKLGLYKIKTFPVSNPPLDAQKQIVQIVQAYDDLIENNKRQIELLEESARQLYKEWFVHFRFPGHEHVKIIDGMPDGWSLKPLKSIASLTMGQSPKSEFYNSDGYGLPFHQGVTKFGFRFVEHEIYCTKPTRLSQPGDILFSVRAPVGRMNITNDVIVLGRGLSAIHSIGGFQSFLFYALKSYFFKEDMIGGGAIYASVTKKDMENQDLLIPTESLLNEFNDFATDIDKQIHNLHQMNVSLTKARDILLPKLMNGEIAV